MLLLFVFAALAAPPDVDIPLTGGPRVRKDAALVVSIEDYTFLPDVAGATHDGDAMAAWLGTARGLERITRLNNPDARALRQGLSEAVRSVRGGGMLWVYFAGHGTADAQGQRIFLTKEAAPDDLSSVALDDVVRAAGSSRAKQVLLVLDADFGGVGRGGEPLGIPEAHPSAFPTAPASNLVIWSGARGVEPAAGYPDASHGLFTWLVLGGLRGWADGGTGGKPNGEVTLEEAQAFVGKMSRQLGGKSWSPTAEVRAEVMKWSLVRSTNLEPGPDKEAWGVLAQSEKSRRVKEASDRLLSTATSDWLELAVITAVATPSGIEKLNGFIARYELAVVSVDGVDVAVNVPEVVDARLRLDGFARDARKAKGKKRSKKGSKTKVVAAPPPVSSTLACDDLVKLEPAAMGGELTPDQLTCLEVKLSTAAKQTDRDKVSRVLLANADGKGSTAEWMRLASRHLDEIDRSDPDLCFRYALTLSREGTIDDGDEVLRWSDYALENKARWEGPTYVARVYNLYRLRAETATRLWIDAEDELVTDRSDEAMAAADEARGLAKNSAREWMDYATAATQPTDRAFRLCETAAGSPDFCVSKPKPVEESP